MRDSGSEQSGVTLMSLHETPMLRRYWKRVGGILIEEYPVVRGGADRGPRYIDGIIVRSRTTRIARARDVSLRGKHIIVVQVKTGRLGMNLMGQAFFSMSLMRKFQPASIQTVALCEKDDSVLRPIFERHRNCKVVTLQM